MQPAIERDPAARAPAARGTERIVHLNRVTKTFGRHVAVDDLTLTIPRGSVYGFIGPNGAGKTSTIRMIMHIHLADRGQVEVLGEPAGQRTARRIGYLPEERGLYPKMRVRDVILYFGRLKGRTRAELAPRIDEWLEKFGLTAWRLKKCQELSKGMQQKVQLIGTLLHEPEIVILDEPFSGLDPVNTRTVKDMMRELKREGRLIVLSTHQMDQVEELCDRIVMIDRGQRVLYGTVREIKKRYADEIRHATGRGNVVVVDGEGDFAAIEGVLKSEASGAALRLTLETDLAPDRYLERALFAGCSVSRFEASPTPLEEIFVHVVTKNGGVAA